MILISFKRSLRSLSRRFSSKFTIKDVLCQQPAEPKINGWVTNIRKMKNITFLEVNDGSCVASLQVVVGQKIADITVGSAVVAEGNLGKAPRGHPELQATYFSLVNSCDHPEYPFTAKQQHPPEYVRNFLHLRAKTKPFAATLRLRHATNKAFRDYLDNNGFFNIHTPILTSNDCEGGGEIFVAGPENKNLLKTMKREGVVVEEAYFDKKAFLTVSGQLHLESMNFGLEKVYTFNPAFRAENSKSPCHLAEFHMLEAEIAFLNDLEEIIKFVDSMVKDVSKNLLDKHSDDLEFVRQSPIDDSWIGKNVKIITFNEAIDILQKHEKSLKTPVKPSEGISKDHENFLVKHLEGPVFVVLWPKEQKPFYMKQNEKNASLVECFDFLVPEVGELAGGSVRECDFSKLNIKVDKSLQWYLDLRRFGSASTSGFGLGFERYLQWMLNIKNIRDVIPFPRWPHNCET